MARREQCRHFNGTMNTKCKAGIHYQDDLVGDGFGWAARLPCIPDSPLRKEPITPCAKYSAKTKEEIDAEENEMKERTGHMLKAIAMIRETKQHAGHIECPKCQGQLQFTVAKSNRHVWGRCSTAGCLTWMM